MTKRILQIILTLDRAGAERQLCLLAAGLPASEFDVHVCALTRDGPLQPELRRAGIPVTVLGKRWGLDPQAFWRLKEHVTRLRPDLIHAWTFPAGVDALMAGRLCGVQRLVVGCPYADTRKSHLSLAAERALVRWSSCIAVNNAAAREFYVRHGLPGEKICLIPNGVALPEPPNGTKRQMLAELGLPEGVRLVGWIGRLAVRKRLKDSIWVADLLKVIRDDVHLLVIGDGPLRDAAYRFRDQVHIRDKVHFLGQRGDVPQLLPYLEVLWSTSECEGQSNVILEAMAAGVPVVASDIPGTRELVIPGATGFLVPVGDRAGFAKHTERLLNDPDLAARLAAAGRARAACEFSVQKMIDRYAELYRRVLLLL